MAVPRQPEKGARLKYQARYRLSAGPAVGMDDKHDQSMPPEEALCVAENARIHDGIVVCRGGQSLVSDNMDGSIVGMIETTSVYGSALAPAVQLRSTFWSSAVLVTEAGFVDPLLAGGWDDPTVTYEYWPGDGRGPISGGGGWVETETSLPVAMGTYRAYIEATNANGISVAGLAYTRFGTNTEVGNELVQSVAMDRAPWWLWGHITKAAAGTTINYDLRATRGIITSWSIDFGDTTVVSGTGTNADWLLDAVGTHAYAAGGTYTVSVRLEGPNGIYESIPHNVTVTAGVALTATIEPPLGGRPITWWHLPETGRTVVFSYNEDALPFEGPSAAPINQWELDYGDGTAALTGTGTTQQLVEALQYATHTYAADGTYFAKLRFWYGASVPLVTLFCHVVVTAGEVCTGKFLYAQWDFIWLTGPPSVPRLVIYGTLAVPSTASTGLTWNLDFGDGTGVVGAGTRDDYFNALDAAKRHDYANGDPRTVTCVFTSAPYNLTLTTSIVFPPAPTTAVGYFS